jgi:hypothetical protein
MRMGLEGVKNAKVALQNRATGVSARFPFREGTCARAGGQVRTLNGRRAG